MAGPLILLEVTEKQPVEALLAAHPEALRAAYEAGGDHWARYILPEHFRPQAARRYGHQPRKRRTIRRKLAAARVGAAILGGRVDNVFSGLMMRAVLANQRITSTRSSAEVRITGPRYLYQHDKRRNQPQKARELTTVLASEARAIARTVDREYHQQLSAVDSKKVTRYGG